MLADEFGASLGVVSYHMRTLHKVRVLRLVKRVAVRGAYEHHYCLAAPELVAARLWGMSATMLEVQAPEGRPVDATVLLDRIAMPQFREITARYVQALAELEQASVRRCRPSGLQRVAVLVGGDHDG